MTPTLWKSRTYLDHGVDCLSIHEMVLDWVLRDLFRVSEHSLVEHKLAVSTSQSCSVARPMRYRGVLGHGHGGALVSLPLCQHVSNVLKPLDEMLLFRIDLNAWVRTGSVVNL